MILPIENWIEKNNFSAISKPLFKESVICYKNNAYRASLLLSYLGFLTALKERILSSNKPSLFPQGEWDALTRRIQNEDSWESAVFDATQQTEKIDVLTRAKTKDAIFPVSESLRLQVKYWKDRRNDSVHNKDNAITNSHVESLWAFLNSNYAKMCIEGGVESLLIKIKRHYDTNFTPVGKDITPLVQEIEFSVPNTELDGFWPLALERIDRHYESWLSETCLEFITKIFSNTSVLIQKSLVNYLKTQEDLLIDVITNNPKLILQLEYSSEEIRNLWHEKLSKHRNPFTALAIMLRNNMIPQTEIEEACRLLIKNTREYVDLHEDHIELERAGLGAVIQEHIFTSSNISKFLWVNARVSLITSYIEKYPLNDEVVEKLCIEFNKASYYSYWLRDNLDEMFTVNLTKKSEFIQIASDRGFKLPVHISSLHV